MSFETAEALVNKRLRIDQVAATIREKHMSPAGSLGLPPLLDERRLQYMLPDVVFSHQALFDRVLIMQLNERDDDAEFYEGTSIIKTQQRQAADVEALPRGIVVSAGLHALDNLRANGVELGHIVTFIKQAPFRLPLASVEGVNFYIMCLRDGDLNTSEDLVKMLREGKVKVERRKFGEQEQHCYVDENGKQWDPAKPATDWDY